LAILRQSVSESIRFGSMKVVLHRYRNGTEPTVELYGLTNVLRDKSSLKITEHRTKIRLKTGPEKWQWKTCNFFKSDPAKCQNGTYIATLMERKCVV